MERRRPAVGIVLIPSGPERHYFISMVESPLEQRGVRIRALGMIPTAVVLTLVLSLSCTQKRPVEPNNPVISAGVSTLSFSAIAGGATPPSQRIPIANAGGGVLNFTATRRSMWLEIFYLGTAPDTIEVYAYAIGLRSGVHEDTIFIRSDDAGNSPVKVPITLNVLPGISIAPGLVVKSVYKNGPPATPETLRVTSEGGGPKVYRISDTPDWLETGYPVGLATERIELNFRSEVVPSGEYSCEVIVTSDEAANLSARALCSLKVEAWRTRYILNHYVVTSLKFKSPAEGWAAGYQRLFDALEGSLFRTTDSGITWFKVNLPHVGALYRLRVVGDRMWIPADSGRLLSESGGAIQMYSLATNEKLTDIAFMSRDTGWVVGGKGVMFRTTDGGSNWVRHTAPTTQTLNGVAFLDNQTGWAVGGKGTLLATSDGGTTWQQAISGVDADLTNIVVTQYGAVWVVGASGTILFRAATGVKWMGITSGTTENLQEIAFATSEHGWIAGSNGAILSTDDGGLTWQRQNSGTSQQLFTVFPVDSLRVFVAGNDAQILDSYSGGK